jgi:hypothetical protein
MRKDANPNFSLTFKVAVNSNTACFDLTVGHPSATEALKAKVTETHGISTLGVTATVSALGFAELNSFGH